jgi:hypothetical protein
MASKRTGSAALALVALVALASVAAAGEVRPASGVYDPVLVGVDLASGVVSGYVRADFPGAGTAAAPQFACRFAFAGVPGKIVAWEPAGGPIAGDAATVDGAIGFAAASLTLKLQSRPGGCQYLMADDAKIDEDLSARRNWVAVRVVDGQRAYFHDGPDERTRRNSFVVRDDGVGVLSLRPGWAEVEFISGNGSTRGWMKTADFYADGPPKSGGALPAAGASAPRAALETFLREYVKAAQGEPDKATRYLAAEADLKAGGGPETLVYLTGSDWCGTGGCALLVLKWDGGSYKLIEEVSPTRLPVRVLDSRHAGWRDLAVWVGGGGVAHGYEAVLEFDGKAYPDNPTTVLVKSAGPAGRNLWSGNDEGAPLFP